MVHRIKRTHTVVKDAVSIVVERAVMRKKPHLEGKREIVNVREVISGKVIRPLDTTKMIPSQLSTNDETDCNVNVDKCETVQHLQTSPVYNDSLFSFNIDRH